MAVGLGDVHENLSTKEMFILSNYSLGTTTLVCIKPRDNFKRALF